MAAAMGPTTAAAAAQAASVGATTANNNGNEDYKPPVPPHRNTGVIVRVPETPRKHRHRGSSGSAGMNQQHGNNNQRHSKQIHHVKPHGKARVGSPKEKDGEEEEFVELASHEDNRHVAKDVRGREVKRATIVGNPMFSSFSTNAVASSMNVSTPTVVSSSSSPPNSSPSSSAASSSSSSSVAAAASPSPRKFDRESDLRLSFSRTIYRRG